MESYRAPDVDTKGDDGDGSRQHDLAAITLRSISDAVMSADASGRVTYLNPAAARLTGWLGDEAMGRRVTDVLHVVDEFTREPIEHPLLIAMSQNRTAKLAPHAMLVRRDGSTVAIEDSAAPIHSMAGSVIGGVVVFRDTTAARAMTAKLLHLAEHDSLTNLPNRVLLRDRLLKAIAHAERHDNKVAVLFVDLDKFKDINDVHGHSTGDRVLQSVALRLMNAVRHSDTVSRHGGDEFVVLLHELASVHDAASTAAKILDALADPHVVDDCRIPVAASIGLVTYPEHGRDPDTLLKQADLAMYVSKGRRMAVVT